MSARNTLLLPRVLGFELRGFKSIFTRDIEMALSGGRPTIVLGGNGLGKTTIMQAVVYALTGGANEAVEEEKPRRWDHRYFHGRLSREEIATAEVEVQFALGKLRFAVARGFSSNAVAAFKALSRLRDPLPANPPDGFETALRDYGGYRSVADFAFIVHRLLYLPESRRLLAWDSNAQVRTFMLLNQDAVAEEEFRERRNHLKRLDSKKRHIRVAITNADQQLSALFEYDPEAGEDDEEAEGSTQSIVGSAQDIRAVAQRAAEIGRVRATLQSEQRQSERLLSEISREIETLREHLEHAEAAAVNALLNTQEREKALPLQKLLENAICPACGTRQPELQFAAQQNARENHCVLCGSDNPTPPDVEIATLRSQLSEKLLAQRALEDLVRSTRAKCDVLRDREYDLQQQLDAVRLAQPVVNLLERHMPKLTREGLIQLKADLEKQEALLQTEIADLQTALEAEYAAFRTAVDLRTNRLRELYTEYATAFLGLTCELADVPTNDRLLKLTNFVPRFDGVSRDRPESCSEAQRFFLDIALRLATIDLATELSKASSTFLCETPENALDVSYIDNVVEMFREFASRGHSVLLTANIQNQGIAQRLLRHVPATERSTSILNLLAVGHLSDVQRRALKRLEALVRGTTS